MKLNFYHSVPSEFFEAKASDLHSLLGGPSIIHLNQGRGKPIFISTLLHGSEHSGFLALQRLLQNPSERELIILIGNTEAAQFNKRHLNHQVDFNRIWSGGTCELAQIAQQVLAYLKDKELFCAIDIHNNTGKNPFYSCINKLDPLFYKLAQLFSSQIVYFTEPHEVISMALSSYCPSVTIEAGLSGEEKGIGNLVSKLMEIFSWKEITPLDQTNEFEIYHTVGRLKLSHDSQIDFKFEAHLSGRDFSFRSDIEEFNFKWGQVGEVWGFSNHPSKIWLEDPFEQDLIEKYFVFKENKIVVKKTFVPAMLTKNLEVIKDDCFGYVMERIEIP